MGSPTTDLKYILRTASIPLPFNESPGDIAAYIVAENPWGCVPYTDGTGPQEAIKILSDSNDLYAEISKKILEVTTGAKRASAATIRKLRAQQADLEKKMTSGLVVLRCNDPTSGMYYADISPTEIRLRGYSWSSPVTAAASQVTTLSALPPTISGVYPNVVTENETSTLEISGTNFKSGVVTQIIHDTKPPLMPNYVEIVSPGKMSANFSYPAGYAGVCDIKVKNKNNGQSILSDGFTILPPANPAVGFLLKRTITINGVPGATLTNHLVPFKIYLGWQTGYDLDPKKGVSTIFVNTGNLKASFDDIRIVGPGNTLLKIEREEFSSSYWGRFSVVVPSLPPEGITATLYYNNPSAPALWSDADTSQCGITTIFTQPLPDWDLSGVASATINGDRLDLTPKEGSINNPWINGISKNLPLPDNFLLEFVSGYSSSNANQNMGEAFVMLGDGTGAKIIVGMQDYAVGSGSPTGPLLITNIEGRKNTAMRLTGSWSRNQYYITRLNGTVKIYLTNSASQDVDHKLICSDTYSGDLNKIVLSTTKSGANPPLIHKLKFMRLFEWYGYFPSLAFGPETVV